MLLVYPTEENMPRGLITAAERIALDVIIAGDPSWISNESPVGTRAERRGHSFRNRRGSWCASKPPKAGRAATRWVTIKNLELD